VWQLSGEGFTLPTYKLKEIRRKYLYGVLKALGIYILVFLVMVLSIMTDEKTPAFGSLMYKVFKNVCGFPLVLMNSNFPFFLESKVFMWSTIPLTILNAFIQVWLLTRLRHLFKPLSPEDNSN
jgi:hypothetical protein